MSDQHKEIIAAKIIAKSTIIAATIAAIALLTVAFIADWKTIFPQDHQIQQHVSTKVVVPGAPPSKQSVEKVDKSKGKIIGALIKNTPVVTSESSPKPKEHIAPYSGTVGTEYSDDTEEIDIIYLDPPSRLLIPPLAVSKIIKFRKGKCAMLDSKKISYLKYKGNHIGYSYIDDVWFNFRQGSEKDLPFKAFAYSSKEKLYPTREYLLTFCK